MFPPGNQTTKASNLVEDNLGVDDDNEDEKKKEVKRGGKPNPLKVWAQGKLAAK